MNSGPSTCSPGPGGSGRRSAARTRSPAARRGVPGVLALPALLSTRKDRRVGTWATANNVEIAYTPMNSSWLNRIEAQFTALRYFTLDGTDHGSHTGQASMIRRYIIWRNNAYDERLRRIVAKANVGLRERPIVDRGFGAVWDSQGGG